MLGMELMIWRKTRKLTQAGLAGLLGVSRETIGNWEAGRNRLPMDITARLERLAYTTAPRSAPMTPALLTTATADHWPHLRLYRRGIKAGTFQRDADHPGSLGMAPPPATRNNPHGHYHGALLDSAEYLQAVERARTAAAVQLVEDNRRRAHNLAIDAAKAAQSRLDHGIEQEGDQALAATLDDLLRPPAEWPHGASYWRNLPQEARDKWCRENGITKS